jgi:hypothetical protein
MKTILDVGSLSALPNAIPGRFEPTSAAQLPDAWSPPTANSPFTHPRRDLEGRMKTILDVGSLSALPNPIPGRFEPTSAAQLPDAWPPPTASSPFTHPRRDLEGRMKTILDVGSLSALPNPIPGRFEPTSAAQLPDAWSPPTANSPFTHPRRDLEGRMKTILDVCSLSALPNPILGRFEPTSAAQLPDAWSPPTANSPFTHPRRDLEGRMKTILDVGSLSGT